MHDVAIVYYGRFVLIVVMIPAIALLGWSQFKAAGRRHSWVWYYNKPRRFNPITLIYVGGGIIAFWSLIAFTLLLPAIRGLPDEFSVFRSWLLATVVLLFVVGIAEMATGVILWRKQKSAGPQ